VSCNSQGRIHGQVTWNPAESVHNRRSSGLTAANAETTMATAEIA